VKQPAPSVGLAFAQTSVLALTAPVYRGLLSNFPVLFKGWMTKCADQGALTELWSPYREANFATVVFLGNRSTPGAFFGGRSEIGART
jgi:hypothetical protein